MTKREFYLKLFSENDTALICAVLLTQRFANKGSLNSGREYILTNIKQLYEEVPDSEVAKVFPEHMLKLSGGSKCKRCGHELGVFENIVAVNSSDNQQEHFCEACFFEHALTKLNAKRIKVDRQSNVSTDQEDE